MAKKEIRVSITNWIIPDNVNTAPCTQDRYGSIDLYTPEMDRVYVHTVNTLYTEYKHDPKLIEDFDFMDKVIRVAKEEHFIETIKAGYKNGSKVHQEFIEDMGRHVLKTNMYSWLNILRSDSLHATDDTTLYDNDHNEDPYSNLTVPNVTLRRIIGRGGLDLLFAMYIVYGMNYE